MRVRDKINTSQRESEIHILKTKHRLKENLMKRRACLSFEHPLFTQRNLHRVERGEDRIRKERAEKLLLNCDRLDGIVPQEEIPQHIVRYIPLYIRGKMNRTAWRMRNLEEGFANEREWSEKE
jgi:hypothetical protein